MRLRYRRSSKAWPTAFINCVTTLGLFALTAYGVGCDRKPELSTIVYGENGSPTLVLLHGYGASAEQWAPFTQTIKWPKGGRFVFPQAPEPTVPPDGPTGGRGWWRLDLRSHIPPGQSVPDISAERPAGLKASASLMGDLLEGVRRSNGGPIVLGGFSQGAMVASEVAFRSDEPLRGLVVLSGTLVDEPSWESNFYRRRGMPVFIAHGRADPILRFEVADRFRAKLEAAGLSVTWCPFDGGHEVPGTVIVELNKFIEGLRLTN